LLFDIWEVLFPKDYITKVILPMMNEKVELGELQYSEFMRWIGLWFLRATVQGPSRFKYWRKYPVDWFSGDPFQIRETMSCNGFNLEAVLTDKQHPTQLPQSILINKRSGKCME
jgi:Transposase IS4